MKKVMKASALFSALLAASSTVLFWMTQSEFMLIMAITFGTTAYHFIMRLLIGATIHLIFRNRMDYRRKRFRVSTWEQDLYQKLSVKKWKAKMPTYTPDCFDPRQHSWHEIAQATCQAELVHEWIILLSFVPVFAAIPFGALGVFLTTSCLAACFDTLFVIMQRYNRPRILKFLPDLS